MAVAEHKYRLALVQTQTEKKIQPQPWYRERLHTKFMKGLKPTDTSQHLTGTNWMFVKDGLDDFRDGLPPAVEGSDFIKTEKGPGPTLTGSPGTPSSVKQPAQPHRFSKHQICFSRVTPLQQQRREHIDEIEYGLLQHPLALYPHLEESVPPEMFEDIVDILDAEMNMVEEEEDGFAEESQADVLREQQQATQSSSDQLMRGTTSARSASDSGKSDRGEEPRVRNPYRWLPRKIEEKDKAGNKDRRSLRERANASPSQEEHIQTVTREFCQWVADLGGESNNIEESTITSLFASGYETKPALSVPIHVVELTNVPPELRMSASVQQPQAVVAKAIPQSEQSQKEWKVSGEYQPSWLKFKYGAWYLPPKTWEKRQWDDQLVDPKELKDQEMSEAKKKSHTLNQELSTMHASKAFMDFINKKSVRKPEFLEEVGEIQRKAAEDELRRQEAELLAKMKKSGASKKAGQDHQSTL